MSAQISLFPSACGDEETARVALAYELIHHWEATVPGSAAAYPNDADSKIASLFSSVAHERRWRRVTQQIRWQGGLCRPIVGHFVSEDAGAQVRIAQAN